MMDVAYTTQGFRPMVPGLADMINLRRVGYT